MDVMAGETRLMPHIHLSLQSGDNMVLKRMKRRHAREDSIAFCHELKSRRPDMVFGADIIAGFPTETEEMFENSLRIVDECGLTYLHVFPFSPRPETPAARMPQLNTGIIRERAQRLRAKGEERLFRFLNDSIGATQRVLVETLNSGRNEQFAQVKFVQNLFPCHRQGPVTGAAGHYLEARLADERVFQEAFQPDVGKTEEAPPPTRWAQLEAPALLLSCSGAQAGAKAR